ncbi:tryptophan 7-halogenase [Paraglaciecola sp.]|uniref:tryptophan 7-halogenase n=1 Tax=Paraglaciecola sp. TaxID=1920173 RepID=UPI003EFAFE48
MSQELSQTVLILGNTFAASMTALALSKSLPNGVKVVWVKPAEPCQSDLLYGGITSPEAYEFNIQYGVTEPELFLNTNTTFTFGTHFKEWGESERSWIQCFHLPFSTISGVDLHHYLTRHNARLGDFLISAQAVLKGTFAHPPTDNLKSALSRAEYGYHFDPAEWAALFCKKVDKARVEIVSGELKSVKYASDQIESVELEDGTILEADLFIDCTGTDSELMSKLSQNFVCQRNAEFVYETFSEKDQNTSNRNITGTKFGWQSITPLRGKNSVLSLHESSLGYEHVDACKVELGYRKSAWQGNCVGIGHSVYAFDPCTPAAYILLKKDIMRLLELFPVNSNTQVERQEYNRRFQNDVIHAELFLQALYAQQRDVGFSASDKLDRKLVQYLHRGILSSYDFEPFNQQDWAILHAGLGRIPKRYDRMADQVDFDQMQNQLDKMRAGIAHLASSMPPHHIYLEKFISYLRKSQQHGQ